MTVVNDGDTEVFEKTTTYPQVSGNVLKINSFLQVIHALTFEGVIPLKDSVPQ